MHDWQPNEKLEFYHPTIQQKENFSNWKSDWGPKGPGNFFWIHIFFAKKCSRCDVINQIRLLHKPKVCRLKTWDYMSHVWLAKCTFPLFFARKEAQLQKVQKLIAITQQQRPVSHIESTVKASIRFLAKKCSFFRFAKLEFVYLLKKDQGALLQKRTFWFSVDSTLNLWHRQQCVARL